MNKPAFKLVIFGQDITPIIIDRVISIVVVDNAGLDSDTVAIVLDDRDQLIALPSIGVEMTVTLGEYINNKPVLTWAGVYIIDEVETDDNEGTLAIHGKAANMMGSLKAPRSAVYDDIELGELLTVIANRHGYTPIISTTISTKKYVHIDQRAQSDIDLLTSKADELGAICKPTGKRLCILVEDEAKTASGAALPILPLDAKAEGVFIHGIITGSNEYKSVKAYWQGADDSRKNSVSMGGVEPVYEMSGVYKTHTEAEDAMKSKFAQLKRGGLELSCERNLDLSYAAERKVNLFNHRYEGGYVIKTATHSIGKKVSSTELTFKLPSPAS